MAQVKRGFIRALWGTSDEKYDEGWTTPSKRYGRMADDIRMIIEHENTQPFRTYIFGQANYDMAVDLGVQDCVLINEAPFIYDLQKEFWKHKLDIFQYAMEEDGFDEVVYMDWDCVPVKPLFDDFWDILGRKESIQCNLQFYRRRKCLWRTEEWRKTANGGFVYMRDKTIPSKLQSTWETMPAEMKFWDEVIISKYIDDIMGGWQGIEAYWKLHEPMVCNLTTSKKNKSPYPDEWLADKDICFEHFIQALKVRRDRFLKKDDQEA
jgi:hypothetical protein